MNKEMNKELIFSAQGTVNRSLFSKICALPLQNKKKKKNQAFSKERVEVHD